MSFGAPSMTEVKVDRNTQALRISLFEEGASGCGGQIRMQYVMSGDDRTPILKLSLVQSDKKYNCLALISKSGFILVDSRQFAGYNIKIDISQIQEQIKIKLVLVDQLK